MNRAARRAEKFGKRSRHVDPTGGLGLLEKANWAANVLPQHKVDEVQLLALASLDAITKGHGTAEHIGAISLACNMTGALVLDAFMGSGATGDACARLGRRFIGIERDREHFESACRRLEQQHAQAGLFA